MKFCFSFLLFTLYFVLFTLTAHAVQLPVIIDFAEVKHPNTTQDQNFLSSDPAVINTVKHPKTITLRETHDPTIVGYDDQENPIYEPKIVNNISGNLNFKEFTNNGLKYINGHLAKRYTDPLGDTNTEFLSYSSSNATRRSLPAHLQKCLIGQRMVSAIRTLNGDFSDTGVDVIICPASKCDHQVRISEVAFFFRHQPYFYDPTITCPATATDGQPLSSFVSFIPIINTPLDLESYQKLYQYGIEPVEDNSLGSLVEHCDLNADGQIVKCETFVSSAPRAAGPASRGGHLASLIYTPSSAKTISRDYSQSSKGTPIADKPNPITALATFFKQFFITEPNQQISGPHKITYSIDSRLEEGLNYNETANRHLLPASVVKTLKSSPSSTNGVTLDPGKAAGDTIEELTRWLHPASEQPKF